jgi:hypothetical protein
MRWSRCSSCHHLCKVVDIGVSGTAGWPVRKGHRIAVDSPGEQEDDKVILASEVLREIGKGEMPSGDDKIVADCPDCGRKVRLSEAAVAEEDGATNYRCDNCATVVLRVVPKEGDAIALDVVKGMIVES